MKVCAAGIIFRNNKVLLGKRNPTRYFYPNVWDLPGGHSEAIENPEDTLIRELKEELGITITEYNYVTLLHEPNSDKFGEYDYHIFSATNWLGTISNKAPDEHTEFRWFNTAAAMRLELANPGYAALFQKLIPVSGSSSRKP